jgi:hypothetical protein
MPKFDSLNCESDADTDPLLRTTIFSGFTAKCPLKDKHQIHFKMLVSLVELNLLPNGMDGLKRFDQLEQGFPKFDDVDPTTGR